MRSNVVTRSQKSNDNDIFETRTLRGGRGTTLRGGRGTPSNRGERGGRATSFVGGSRHVPQMLTRETRSVEAQPVQPVQHPRQRPVAQMLPPRMPSQRILHKKLSAPVTGPGSSIGNEILVD